MTFRTTICIVCFIFCDIFMQVVGEYCKEYGQSCPIGLSCCGSTCCARENYHHGFRWSVWNMWYFWFIVIFILMSCFGGCGYWRRRQLMLHQQQTILQHQQAYNNYMHQATFNMPPPHTSISVPPYGAAGPPPTAAQAEGSFPAPPPYSEATKPYFYSPNKDGLPPYPEGPYNTEYNNLMAGANQGSGAGVINSDSIVPGLPPYSAVADVSPAVYPTSATQQPTNPGADQSILPTNSQPDTYSTPVATGVTPTTTATQEG